MEEDIPDYMSDAFLDAFVEIDSKHTKQKKADISKAFAPKPSTERILGVKEKQSFARDQQNTNVLHMDDKILKMASKLGLNLDSKLTSDNELNSMHGSQNKNLSSSPIIPTIFPKFSGLGSEEFLHADLKNKQSIRDSSTSFKVPVPTETDVESGKDAAIIFRANSESEKAYLSSLKHSYNVTLARQTLLSLQKTCQHLDIEVGKIDENELWIGLDHGKQDIEPQDMTKDDDEDLFHQDYVEKMNDNMKTKMYTDPPDSELIDQLGTVSMRVLRNETYNQQYPLDHGKDFESDKMTFSSSSSSSSSSRHVPAPVQDTGIAHAGQTPAQSISRFGDAPYEAVEINEMDSEDEEGPSTSTASTAFTAFTASTASKTPLPMKTEGSTTQENGSGLNWGEIVLSDSPTGVGVSNNKDINKKEHINNDNNSTIQNINNPTHQFTTDEKQRMEHQRRMKRYWTAEELLNNKDSLSRQLLSSEKHRKYDGLLNQMRSSSMNHQGPKLDHDVWTQPNPTNSSNSTEHPSSLHDPSEILDEDEVDFDFDHDAPVNTIGPDLNSIEEMELASSKLVSYMKKTYFYCPWCKKTYDGPVDMLARCPGDELSQHDI